MTAPAVPATPATQYSLTNPPPGSTFLFAKVKTDRGQTDLGEVPILTWGETDEDIQHAIAYYGAEGISNILGGTSLRVSFQGIARTAKEKAAKDPSKAMTDEQIAKAQIDFRPGKREGGQSTPASRLGNQAKKLAEKANPNVLAELLKMVEEGKLDVALLQSAGLANAADLYTVPAAADNGAAEEEEVQQDQ
jgi:hypothetical protein